MNSSKQLAIHGGKPVRAVQRVANPRIAEAAKADVLEVLERGALTRYYGGERVRALEGEFAAWFGQDHAVALNSGTSALHVAYVALGLPAKSEVLVPANAYVSAISALIQTNLIPIIVDVDPRTWVMDVEDARRKIGPRTRAIVPVHMYGQPCDMDAVVELARAHDLVVVEDCGQSHGGTWNGRLTGTFGLMGCFSICCRKHVTAGEGGLVITNEESLVERMRSLAHKGKGPGFYDYIELGFSYNMTELQAVVALHGLRQLEQEVQRRQRYAGILSAALADLDIELPELAEHSSHAYFKFNLALPVELQPWRFEIVHALRCEGIGADPCHPYVLTIDWLREQRPYFYSTLNADERPYYGLESCPHAADILSRQLGIVVGPGLDDGDIDDTLAACRKVLGWYLERRGHLAAPCLETL